MSIKLHTLDTMQAAHIAAYAEDWTAIGLATEPSEWNETERWIDAVYQQWGFPTPEFIWCKSPYHAIKQINTHFQDQAKRPTTPVFNFNPAFVIYGQTWAALQDRVAPGIWHQVRQELYDVVKTAVHQRVWSAVWNSLEANLRDDDWGQIVANLGMPLTEFGCGQFNADVLGLFAFYREVCALFQETDAVVPWIHAAQHCGWWIPCPDACFVIDRFQDAQFDQAGRLHGEGGPALIYRDGFSVYAWHGVRVPEHIVTHPDEITIEEISSQRNVELRRVLMERYGVRRFIVDSGAQIIDESDAGILYRLNDNPGEREPLVMLCVKNNTPELDGSYRRYILRVPPTMQTAQEAVAWTFGLSPDEYHPIIET